MIFNDIVSPINFDSHLNENFQFYNNIFISKGSTIKGGLGSEKFLGNCYWTVTGGFNMAGETSFNAWRQQSGQETMNGFAVGMSQNPMIKKMGMSSLTDPMQLKNVFDYQISDNSPVVNKGLDLKTLFGINPGTNDYFGNINPSGKSNMGIHNQPNGNVTSLSFDYFNTSLVVSPNPSQDGKFALPTTNNWKVFDFQGMKLKSGFSDQIDLSQLANGMYFVKIDGVVKTVVKE